MFTQINGQGRARNAAGPNAAQTSVAQRMAAAVNPAPVENQSRFSLTCVTPCLQTCQAQPHPATRLARTYRQYGYLSSRVSASRDRVGGHTNQPASVQAQSGMCVHNVNETWPPVR